MQTVISMEPQARYVRVHSRPQDPFQSTSPPPHTPFPPSASSSWPPHPIGTNGAADGPPALPAPSGPPPSTPSPPASSLAGRACFFLLGAGLLAAWNALITATDYFQAVYPGWHTDRMFTLAYLPLCLVTLAYAIRYPDLPPSPVRIRVGYGGFAAAMGAVPLLDAWLVAPGNNTSSAGTLLAATAPPAGLVAVLICVALVGACDGLCQGAVFGAAAQLPPPYTHAVVSGTAISGLLVCLLRITSKASFEAAAAAAVEEGDDPAARLRAGTRLYFTMAGLLSLSCLLVYDLVLPHLSGGLRREPPPARRHHHHNAQHTRGPHTHTATTATDTDAQEHLPLLQPPTSQPPARQRSIELGSRTDSGSWGAGSGHGSGVLDGCEGSWGGDKTGSGGSGSGGLVMEPNEVNPTPAPHAAQIPLSASPPHLRWLGDSEPATTITTTAIAASYTSTTTLHGDISARPDRSDSEAALCSSLLPAVQRPLRDRVAPSLYEGSRGPSLSEGCGRGVLPPQVAHCLALCWPLCGALVLTYGTTLAIFPGFLAEDVQSALLGDWYPLLLITAFNAADFIGKTLPCLQPMHGGAEREGVPTQQHTHAAGGTSPSSPSEEEEVRPLLVARGERVEPGAAGGADERPPELEGCDGGSSVVTGHRPDETLIEPPGIRQHHQHQQRHYTAHGNGHTHPNPSHRNHRVPGSRPVVPHVVRGVASGVLGVVVRPLRSPRGLLAAAAVRVCVALPAFLCADRWGAPAGVMAALTAALGVTNGYLTSQVLTMGPSSVLAAAPAAVGVGGKTVEGQQPAEEGVQGRVVEWDEEEVGAAAGGHADAEVVENLLVLSLVGGLNLGAYLGWLWLL